MVPESGTGMIWQNYGTINNLLIHQIRALNISNEEKSESKISRWKNYDTDLSRTVKPYPN